MPLCNQCEKKKKASNFERLGPGWSDSRRNSIFWPPDGRLKGCFRAKEARQPIFSPNPT
jgi:hypothetical protein